MSKILYSNYRDILTRVSNEIINLLSCVDFDDLPINENDYNFLESSRKHVMELKGKLASQEGSRFVEVDDDILDTLSMYSDKVKSLMINEDE